MTETEQAPTTNGLPEESEEDEKAKLRPPDIDADVREMEKRKRVEMIMSSKLFREELERIIESQMKEGGGPAGLIQQIQDMVGASRLQANFFKGSNCVLPVNDIRGVEAMGYAKGEKVLRCKLASVFRLLDLYGWSHGINNLITGRLMQENEEFLVNPHGLMYHEVTASSLVKVDMQGNVIEKGTTNLNVNSVAFRLHAALHAARPDIKCVIHVRNPPVLAISSLKCGLLPISAESAVIGEVSSHHYIGSVTEPEERDKIARSLGPINKVLLLTNHGALCCGETVEEAFFNVYNTVLACETQAKLMPIGLDNLISLPDEGRKALYDSAHKAPANDKKWRVGGLEFEALMRMLDNAGFRTGYIYRSPLVKGEPPKPKNDVELPPAVSSLGYLLEEEEMYKQGNWKKGVNRSDRSRWLNSPNVYQKVEILETGTTDPKKITKWVDANNAEEWVADGSPAHTSTPVKIDAALQFVPKNTNPKEFKKLQQQIKENRRADKITSGPQSHILEGVSWEEAKKLQDANISMTGDQVILVGAASKGIIQRGFQNNATVYKSPYSKNPFDQVSEQELEEYKNTVTRKQKGEYYGDDTEQSESEALSSSAALIRSEQDDTSEPQVLRIETKTAPAPSQAEVVLSDDDARIVKCRLVQLEEVSSQKLKSIQLATIGTQTNPKISSEDCSSESTSLESPHKLSRRALSIPDILKTSILDPHTRDRLRKTPDSSKTTPGKEYFLNSSMSLVMDELTQVINKRKLLSNSNESDYFEESIIQLPSLKSLSAPPGSPSGFSSNSDETSVSLELDHDDQEEPACESKKPSLASLEECIGEQYEAFVAGNIACRPQNTVKPLSYCSLNRSFESFLDIPPAKKGNSFESVCAEHDNMSTCTFISSPDISSIIDCDEAVEYASNSSSDPEEAVINEYHNKWNRKEVDVSSGLVVSGSMSVDFSKPLEKDSVNKVVLKLSKTRCKDSDGSCLEYVDDSSTRERTSSSSSSVVTVISRKTFEERAKHSNDTQCDLLEADVLVHHTHNGNTLNRKLKILNNSFYLDENENNSPFHPEKNLNIWSPSDGYDGDIDNTVYPSLSFSPTDFDLIEIPPRTSGYEADLGEMSTSFSYSPNSLYTIQEELLSPEV